MRTVLIGGVGLLGLLGACAPTADRSGDGAAPAARQCFNIQQVDNFRQGRPDQVFIRVGRNDVYELTAAGCPDLDFAHRLALVPDGAGLAGSRLCTDDWARVVVPGATTPASVCRVRISRRLTEAEIAALPAAHRP